MVQMNAKAVASMAIKQLGAQIRKVIHAMSDGYILAVKENFKTSICSVVYGVSPKISPGKY